MAYASLLNARSDFSNFGSSLAAVQENAVDVASSNEQTETFYKSVSAQMTATGLIEGFPSVASSISAGMGLYKSIKRLGDIKPLVDRGLGEGRDLLQSGASDLLKTAKTGLGQLETGVNNIRDRVNVLGDTITAETAGVEDTVRASAGRILNSVETSGQSVLASVQDEAANAVVSVESGARELGSFVRGVAEHPLAPATFETAPAATAAAAEDSIQPIAQAASAETRFSLAPAVKRPTTATSATPVANEPAPQQTLTELEPEEPIMIDLGYLKEDTRALTRGNMAGLESTNPIDTINGLMTGYGDLSASLRPTLGGFGQRVMSFFGGQSSSAQSAVSSAANNIAGAGRQAVTTTMDTATTEASGIVDRAASAVRNVAGAGEGVVSSAVETGSALAGTAVEAGETAAKLAVGLGDIAIPVIGEIGLIGVGVYSAIQGFEDLFSRPAAPKVAPVPVVSNISQSFQSGI
jgi:hypothetical protein